MKGVRLSMMYQYFDAQERKLSEEIESLERITKAYMYPDDIIRLIKLKAKKETLQSVFNDLYKFIVDFDQDFK